MVQLVAQVEAHEPLAPQPPSRSAWHVLPFEVAQDSVKSPTSACVSNAMPAPVTVMT